MKNIISSLVLCALPLTAAIAQEEQPTNSLPASSLELSGNRTQTERIAFLMDVANAYIAEKDFPAAIDAYERILQIDPTHLQTRQRHLVIQYRCRHVLCPSWHYQKSAQAEFHDLHLYAGRARYSKY